MSKKKPRTFVSKFETSCSCEAFVERGSTAEKKRWLSRNKNGFLETLALPAPTAWPFVTAFGIALLAAGLVTQAVMSVVGLILAVRGAVGWFRDVLPVEQHELVRVRPLEQRARPIAPAPRAVLQFQPGVAGHRVRIPAEIHPYSSGIKGGIFGGIAMAVVAVCMVSLRTAASGIRLICWRQPLCPPWLKPTSRS